MMRHWSRRRKILTLAPLALVGALLFVALGGEIVKLLWNGLLPTLFGWTQISFWQALGILVLCRILFGGLGGHGGGSRSRLGRRMAANWERMTPEERERFRQGMRDRCGFGPPTGPPTGEATGQ